MATTFSGNMNIGLKGYLTKALDIGTATLLVDYSKKWTQTNGTGADQANMMWTDTRTLTASSTESLDLYGGLTNAFGDTINLTSIQGLLIFADSANTNNVLVGGAASNAVVNWVGDATDKVVVKPGGIFFLYDPTASGDAVTDSTGDLLKIANSSSGTSVSYDIIIIGKV